MTTFRLFFTPPGSKYYHAPDKEGRRQFTLTWIASGGEYRPEPHKKDGKPVGMRRGQVFYTNPDDFRERNEAKGNTVRVVATEAWLDFSRDILHEH